MLGYSVSLLGISNSLCISLTRSLTQSLTLTLSLTLDHELSHSRIHTHTHTHTHMYTHTHTHSHTHVHIVGIVVSIFQSECVLSPLYLSISCTCPMKKEVVLDKFNKAEYGRRRFRWSTCASALLSPDQPESPHLVFPVQQVHLGRVQTSPHLHSL
jgi:hypothetical protein